MSDTYAQQFSLEEVNKLRSLHEEGDATIVTDLENVVGDRETADMILAGPDRKLVSLLKDNPDDQELSLHVDNLFGRGAAEFYRNQTTALDVAASLPGEAARGIAHGVTGAIAETAQFTAEALDTGAGLLGSSQSDLNNSQIAKMEERLASLQGQLAEPRWFQRESVIKAEIEKAEAELSRLRGLGETLEADPNASRFELDSTDVLGDTVGLPETGFGAFVQGGTQFLTGFVGPAGSLGKLKAVAQGGLKAKLAAGIVAGIVADATAFDPNDPTIAQTLNEQWGIDAGIVTDYLTKTDEDGRYEKRFKTALEGAGLGLMTELVFQGVRGALRVRAGQRTPQELSAELEQAVRDLQIEVRGPTSPVTREQAAAAVQQSPSTQKGYLRVFESLNGQPKDVPQGQPTSPTLTQHMDTIAAARTFIAESTETFDAALKQAEETILKRDGNVVTDNTMRSFSEAAKFAKGTFSMINRHAIAGGEANWEALIAWSRSAKTPEQSRIMDFAFRQATQASKDQVTIIREKLEGAYASRSMDPKVIDAVEAELGVAMERYLNLRSIDQDLGSEAGRRLNERKANIDMAEVVADPNAPKPSMTDANVQATKQRQFSEQISWEKAEYERLIDLGLKPSQVLDMLKVAQRERANVKGFPKNTQNDSPKTAYELMDGFAQQVRYSSMLSGTATHFVNITSSLLNGTRIVGTEVLTPGRSQFGRDRAMGMISALPNALTYARKSMVELRPFLSASTKLDHVDPVTKNILLTWPQRFMMGTDELFRQMWYQGEITAKAYEEGRLAGLTGDALDKHVADRLAATLKDGVATDLVAEANSAALTFQRRLDPRSKYVGERAMAGIEKMANATMATRILFPFARVSMDLLDVGYRMTPGLREAGEALKAVTGAESRFLDDLRGTNGVLAKTRAQGELVMGYALTGSVIALHTQGLITGGNPPNYREATLENESGPPPYSIYVGGEWVPYDRYEPFATPLKFMANALDAYSDYQEDVELGIVQDPDGERAAALLRGTTFVFAELLASQPYMEGGEQLVDLFAAMGTDQFGDQTTRMVTSTGESYIPNILKKLNQALGAHEGEFIVQKGQWGDMFSRHFSSFIDGYEGDLRRSPLTGEVKVLSFDQKTQRWLPAWSATAPDNPGVAMLNEANQYYGSQFYLKQPTAFAGMGDLRTIMSEDGGRSLYDRFLEFSSSTPAPENTSIHGLQVGGLTYPEALDALAAHPDFVALPWRSEGVDLDRIDGSTSKRKWILDVKRQYQGLAEHRLAGEDRVFRELLQETETHKKRQTTGERLSLEIR